MIKLSVEEGNTIGVRALVGGKKTLRVSHLGGAKHILSTKHLSRPH